MSLLNVLVCADRVDVVTDSRTESIANGGPGSASKLHIVALPAVLLAGRGIASVPLVASIGLQHRAPSFDACLAMLPGLVRDALQAMATGAAAQGIDPQNPALAQHELVMAGWSNRLGRMAAVHVLKRDAQALLQVEMIEPGECVLAPHVDGVTDGGQIHTGADLVTMARRQLVAWNLGHPMAPLGGPLQVAELRQGRITISTVTDA